MLVEGLTDGLQQPIKRDADGNLCVAGTFAAEAPVGGATEAKQDAIIAALPVPARTPTTTPVASSATSVTILAANANRRGISIANLSTQFLYLSFSTPATTSNAFMRLDPGMFMLLDQQMIIAGAIYGIWAAAAGTAQVTEYV